MKKIHKTYILAVLGLMMTLQGLGQRLKMSTSIEKTIMGVQLGSVVSYEFANHFSIGGFYQKNLRGTSETDQRKYEFTGGIISVPIAQCTNIMVSGNLRAGLSNKRFVIVTPGVETEISISKLLSVSLGVSIRAAEAAISSRLIIRL